MKYAYKALKDEKTVNGTIEAGSVEESVAQLKAGGYFPIEVTKDAGKQSSLERLLDRVSFTDVVNFTRQLSIMLNAGVTLIEALDIFKKQTTKPSYLHLIEDIDRDIRGGVTFSDSLRKHPELFSSLYISLVRAGEASGKLNEVLMSLATNLEKQRELQGRIKGALIYPFLIVIGMFVVIFIMITFVIPQLLSLYDDLGAELPLSTKIISALSEFSTEFWPFILFVVGMIGLGVWSYIKSPKGKRQFDKLTLKTPVFKDIIIQSTLVEMTRTISILVGAGVSILDALNIAKTASENSQFRESFDRIYKNIEKGVTFGDALQREPLFPALIVQMAVVGEKTGHLDETMGKISHYYEVETELAVKSMTTLIEPAILVVLGITIGFIIFSVITPIYSLTSQF